MICIPKETRLLGSSQKERSDLGLKFDFHPSLLADELEHKEYEMKEFFIDDFPVTNAQFAAFLEQTKRLEPLSWKEFAKQDRADHPVVGVSAEEALAFAAWAGKRLPTPEEWEAAMEGAHASPITFPEKSDWSPRTSSKENEPAAKSRFGLAGFGQICEWTSATIPHHSTTFQLLKGPAWMMQEEWSFRPQTSMWVVPSMRSSYMGFRCAANMDCPPVKTLALPPSHVLQKSPARPEYSHFTSDGAKNIAVRFSLLPSPVGLNCPEGFSTDGKGLIQYYTKPKVEWEQGYKGPADKGAYNIRCEDASIHISHRTENDTHAFEYEFLNSASMARNLSASTCVRLNDVFNLHDIEGNRTFFWPGSGDWILFRKMPRTSDCCTRWIVGVNKADIPVKPSAMLTAVLGRDGKSVFGYGRVEIGESFHLSNNFYFTCLHIDPKIRVEANASAKLKAQIYYLQGGLEELKKRFVKDFKINE